MEILHLENSTLIVYKIGESSIEKPVPITLCKSYVSNSSYFPFRIQKALHTNTKKSIFIK